MRRALLACALALGASDLAADPVALGAEIYARICLECHGPTASEGQSGDIRGLSRSTVTSAVRAGPGMMPTIPLTADEIAAVVAYLAQL